jgi:hypothetical protein
MPKWLLCFPRIESEVKASIIELVTLKKDIKVQPQVSLSGDNLMTLQGKEP